MRDLHRGSTFAGTTDGLARVIPLRRLSDAELRRLSSLVGGDATAEVLHPGSHHLVDPNDFRVRVAMERDALALAQVYGVDELALRAMNTVRYLQTAVQRVLELEQGSSAQSDSAQVAQLRAECAQLVANLASQKTEYETNVAALEAAHAEAMLTTPAPISTSVPSLPPPGKLQDEIDALRAAAGRLSCEKSDLQDKILALTREVKRLQECQDLRDKRFAELETELAGVQKFSAAALMDFLGGALISVIIGNDCSSCFSTTKRITQSRLNTRRCSKSQREMRTQTTMGRTYHKRTRPQLPVRHRQVGGQLKRPSQGLRSVVHLQSRLRQRKPAAKYPDCRCQALPHQVGLRSLSTQQVKAAAQEIKRRLI
ncbi:hypothetical protein PF003_g11664 [Phytophthora fragariae]|nr:hypothetical protein PF003_g11664 [Phytophthora fragariae]